MTFSSSLGCSVVRRHHKSPSSRLRKMASLRSEREPLLARLPPAISPPAALTQTGVEQMAAPVTMPAGTEFSTPAFTQARRDTRKRAMPQCIAHRGYRATCPENTMLAFRSAIAVGAHAVETDVHLTKDDVVVLSHDTTLKRCFGKADKIIDRTWDEIKDLRTTQSPHERMPRLVDLLDLLSQGGNEDIWCLLDIKLDNDAEEVMRLIGSTIATHSASTAAKPWTERIVLGIWASKYLALCLKYLPDFPVMHIGFSVAYAKQFFEVEKVGFNMLFPMLVAPGGAKFLRDAKQKYHRQVLAWTVNEKDRMEWCIRHGLDGVITDDPKRFLEVCEEYDDAKKDPFLPIKLGGLFDVFRAWIWVSVLAWLFHKRLSRLAPVASKDLIKKEDAK